MPLDTTITVDLPVLHSDQVKAFNLPGRFKVVRCGRRWGKTVFGETVAADNVIKGRYIGYFTPAPAFKYQSEVFSDLSSMLAPVLPPKGGSNKMEGIIHTINGGRLDFWTLDNENAGRSRRYHGVIIDEAAFTKPNMMQIWERAIKPTLLDYGGWALVLSNTNGISPDNFLWQICNEARHQFVEYHAPTMASPVIPLRMEGETEEDYQVRRKAVFDDLIASFPPLVYQQEYLAEFVDWSGVAFFALHNMLVENKPVSYPIICDNVFATIDTATKTGKKNDGTGVSFWARSRHVGHSLVLLDWDYIQIEGSILEVWLPTVFERLEKMATQCRARMGVAGAFIEDKDSGSILLQQATRKGWPVHKIDSDLTAMGKSERAVNASGYVYRGEMKISNVAYDRTVPFKNPEPRNHWLLQVLGFRVGDDEKDVADDLLDTMTYGIMLGLGDTYGF